MVLSLACIIISLYYEVMERSFYRKAVKLVKPDLNIFLVKIIFYLSSGIGKNKISCLKKKTIILPVSTSAVQISAKGALFSVWSRIQVVLLNFSEQNQLCMPCNW